MANISIDATIGYGNKAILPHFALTINPGINILVGANGTGKSTLLRTLAGIQPPLEGTVRVDNCDIRHMSRRRLSQLMSIVHTDRAMSGGLTVAELVSMGRYPHTGLTGHLSRADRTIVAEAMERVGITPKSTAFLSRISDGERQKTMIARALAQQTPIMLLDEPTSFLDAASRLEILRLLRDIVSDSGINIILSSHDTPAALSVADNVISIVPGGTPAVDIAPAGSDRTTLRLNSIFADRGVTFDPRRNDFILCTSTK